MYWPWVMRCVNLSCFFCAFPRQVSKYSYGFSSLTERAARIAAAAIIDVVDEVLRPDSALVYAFVAARPPSHHAVGNASLARGASPRNHAFGYCHLNSISSAIAVAQRKYGIKRAVVLDWDVHPGRCMALRCFYFFGVCVCVCV